MARSFTRSRRNGPPSGSKGLLTFPRGTVVFDSTHPCRRLFLLRSGHIQLSADREAVVELLAPGAFFGQQCLLPAARIAETARTLSEATLSAFTKGQARRLMDRDGRFALGLVRSLARRLEGYEERIRDFILEPAQSRLARLLLRLAPPRPAQGWVRLPGDLTNPDLARMIGTTRERVSRFLSEFQQHGCVRRDRGLWIDRERLSESLRSGERTSS